LLPIARQALLAIARPAALTMLGVIAIELPVRELLRKVLSALASPTPRRGAAGMRCGRLEG
jgi:hypothetical protein